MLSASTGEFPRSCEYLRLVFAYTRLMSPNIGGYEERLDWPKMGPSLLISTCLILAIRTSKKSASHDAQFSATELDTEIEYAAHLAGRVLAILLRTNRAIFPQRKEPWYQADEDGSPS
jgi:hypothetical protein